MFWRKFIYLETNHCLSSTLIAGIELCENGSVPDDSFFASDVMPEDQSYDRYWCVDYIRTYYSYYWEETPYPWWAYYSFGDTFRLLRMTFYMMFYTPDYSESFTNSVIMLSLEEQPDPISLNNSHWILVYNTTPYEDPNQTAPEFFTEALKAGSKWSYYPPIHNIAIDPPRLARYAGIHVNNMPGVHYPPFNGSLWHVDILLMDIVTEGKYYV